MTSTLAPAQLAPAHLEAAWRTQIRRFGSVTCLATADWDAPLWTNKQHIASRLAQEVPTLYVESLGLRRPRLSARDLRRIARRVRGVPGREVFDTTSEIEIVSPLVVPIHGMKGVRLLNRQLLLRELRPRVRRLQHPRLLWTYSPLTTSLVDLADFDLVAYHCVDDLATVPRTPTATIRAAEADLARRADFVFCSAPSLADRLRAFNDRTLYTPNVGDSAHFARALEAGQVFPEMAALPHPRAVFVGALTDFKIDWTLLERVACLLPGWSFAFVGPTGDEKRMRGWRSLQKYSNCHFLGLQPYERLPDILRGASVGLVPYVLSEHTRGVFPLKTMEYLAAGLPVVATPLDSLSAEDVPSVALARTAADFANAVATTETLVDGRQERSAYAGTRTWDSLLTAMTSAMTAAV
jgi:glycosyltransferase involved in cell wall biosynthesis